MDYVGQIIRPPSEANSIILQVTVGCSHNKCTFCGAYKEKRFALKDQTVIDNDLSFAANYCKRQNKVFLADGDALILPYPRLIKLLSDIKNQLPWVNRVSLYGNARSIRKLSVEQLVELKKRGLHRIYLGLESGSDTILAAIQKGETAQSMVEAAQKVRDAGLFLSVTVLLGLGQQDHSVHHATETAKVINQMKPNQTAALTFMPLENTSLGQEVLRGDFILLKPDEILLELKVLLENISINTQFHANHGSNYLPLIGRLPRDKEKLIQLIDQGVRGGIHLVPEYMRRL